MPAGAVASGQVAALDPVVDGVAADAQLLGDLGWGALVGSGRVGVGLGVEPGERGDPGVAGGFGLGAEGDQVAVGGVSPGGEQAGLDPGDDGGGPHHQPYARLRAAHAAAGRWLRHGGPGARPAPRLRFPRFLGGFRSWSTGTNEQGGSLTDGSTTQVPDRTATARRAAVARLAAAAAD